MMFVAMHAAGRSQKLNLRPRGGVAKASEEIAARQATLSCHDAAAALSAKLVSFPEFPSGLLFFLFLLHPASVSVVLLVRSCLLFAACSFLGFLGVVVVDVVL